MDPLPSQGSRRAKVDAASIVWPKHRNSCEVLLPQLRQLRARQRIHTDTLTTWEPTIYEKDDQQIKRPKIKPKESRDYRDCTYLYICLLQMTGSTALVSRDNINMRDPVQFRNPKLLGSPLFSSELHMLLSSAISKVLHLSWLPFSSSTTPSLASYSHLV